MDAKYGTRLIYYLFGVLTLVSEPTAVLCWTQLYSMRNISDFLHQLTEPLKGLNFDSHLELYLKQKRCDDVIINFNGVLDKHFEIGMDTDEEGQILCPSTVNANVNMCRWPPIILETDCKKLSYDSADFSIKCSVVTKPMLINQSYSSRNRLSVPALSRFSVKNGCSFSELKQRK